MTVKELIAELGKYPDWIEVEMSMKVEVGITAGKGRQVSFKESVFLHGKVYGVQGTTGGKHEVLISGS